jgi:hypothetical protein
VGRQRDREAKDWCGDGGHVRPYQSAPYAEPGERRGGQSGGCDEARDGDVQVRDVVVEIVAERADFVSPDVDLLGPDTEFEERAGEVADEEDHRVPDEADTGERHQGRTGAQCGRFGGGRRVMSGRCHDGAS